jgi:hypothetical protein
MVIQGTQSGGLIGAFGDIVNFSVSTLRLDQITVDGTLSGRQNIAGLVGWVINGEVYATQIDVQGTVTATSR